MVWRLHHLKVGLALVLVLVGAKMLAAPVYHVPIAASLAVTAALIGGSVAASLLRPRPKPLEAREARGLVHEVLPLARRRA
jgi:tellurite resistance protein TerC